MLLLQKTFNFDAKIVCFYVLSVVKSFNKITISCKFVQIECFDNKKTQSHKVI